MAVYIVEASVIDRFSLLGSQDARQAAFPADPDADYQHLEAHLLDIMALHQAEQSGEGLDDFGQADLSGLGDDLDEGL